MITSISQAPRGEALYRNVGLSDRGKQATWRLEQKTVARMKDLVEKFTRDDGLGGELLPWCLSHGEGLYAA